MPFAAILVGIVVLVVALRGTHGDLGKALVADVPGFFKWLVAIGIILGLGYIPGFEKPSRWLLGLVALVIVLTQYQKIFAGFTGFASSSGTPSGTPTPSPAVAASQSIASTPTTASISGTSGGSQANPTSNVPTLASATPSILANPSSLVTSLERSIGFGGFA